MSNAPNDPSVSESTQFVALEFIRLMHSQLLVYFRALSFFGTTVLNGFLWVVTLIGNRVIRCPELTWVVPGSIIISPVL